MSVKKVIAVIIVLLFILAAVLFLAGYFKNTKQVYEGVLVYQQILKI